MEYDNLQIEIPVEEEEKERPDHALNPAWEKKYHNKTKGFAINLDLNSKEAVSRKQNRAKRFGIKGASDDDNKTKEDSFQKIDLVGIKWPPVTEAAFAEVRPEAVHIYGVDKMSTKDVFDYLKDHGPDTMEWIDDYSCNVVWESEQGAKFALKGMSRTFDEVMGLKEDNDQTVDEADEEAREIWRIALPYTKGNALFMRQATADDKKLPGAAKRSLYYLTHGRGRGNKRKGIVSASRKRKIQQAESFAKANVRSKGPDVTFFEVEEKNAESDDDLEEMDVDDDEPFAKRLQLQKSGDRSMRMRMYADDVVSEKKDSDIFSRLGNEHLKIEVTTSFEKKNRWTSGRRNHHKRGGSSSEEDEDEEDVNASSGNVDLRDDLDSKHNKSQADKLVKDKNNIIDLRQKIAKNKKHLGLTKDQLNLCIEVTEVSDEEDV